MVLRKMKFEEFASQRNFRKIIICTSAAPSGVESGKKTSRFSNRKHGKSINDFKDIELNPLNR